MERLGAFIKKHRLWLGGLCCALAAAFALAWAGYTLHQAGKNQSEYKIVHDEYVEKQGLYPTDPAAGLVQGLPAGEGKTLYGVRLMFVTGGRVAQGAFRVALESADGQTLAACDGDMTMLLDGAFVDVIFASPVTLEKGSGYQLHVTFAPATAEDKAGLVYGEGVQADPAMPLADRLSSDWTLRTAALQYITNHTGAGYALRAFAPLAALVFLAVMVGWWLIFVRGAKAHVCFAFFAAALGLVFALVTPPLAGPDEYGHLATAYALANRITGQPGITEGPDGESLLAMRECDAEYMRDSSGPIGILAYKTMTDELFSTGNSGELTASAQVSPPYSVVALQYLPQTLGILLARALGLGFHAMLLLARLGSVAVFAALGALAVRLAPARKNVFFAAGLLPMALSLAGSVSADTLVNGLALVFTALCLRGLLCTEQLGRAEQAGLLVLAALIGPMKAVYLVLVGLCLPIPAAALGGKKRSRAFKALVCLAALAGWLWFNGATVGYMLRSVDTYRIVYILVRLVPLAAAAALVWWRWGKRPWFKKAALATAVVLALVLARGVLWVAANSGETLTPEEYAASIQPNGESTYVYSFGYILSHIPQTVKLLVNTLGSELPRYLQGLVGALPGEPIVYGLEVSWLLTIALLALLVWACLQPAEAKPLLGGSARWTLALVALAVAALSMLAALCWTPINLTTVFGMQGRYLLPVLPAMLLLFSEGRTLCLRRSTDGELRFAAGALAAAVALQSLVLFASAAYKP